MSLFQDSLAEFEKANAQVLGISIDTRFSQNAFAEQLGLGFPLVADWPRHQTCRAYDVFLEDRGFTERVTYVIDPQGVIRSVTADEDDYARHVRDALAAVRAVAGSAS